MNTFRKWVSGKRQRFKDTEFNLDLTYITERIVAMSFPASGFEKCYRNSIAEVSKFLKKNHANKYKVYNLSGRNYDCAKFEGRVEDFSWADHHSPRIRTLFELAKNIYDFLLESGENVVVLHCKSGKGRTGTGICTALIYCGYVSNAADAMQIYGFMRFSNEKSGVTQPSQKRYVCYFDRIYNHEIKSAVPKIFRKLVITTVPRLAKNGIRPYIEIYKFKTNTQKILIYSSKLAHKKQLKYRSTNDDSDVHNKIKICPNMSLILLDDIYIRIYHNTTLSEQLICRFSFNTSFIPQNNKLEFLRGEVDPDSIVSDKRFSAQFKIEMYFENFCNKCRSTLPFEEFCSQCKSQTIASQPDWDCIHHILNAHTYPKTDANIAGHMSECQKVKDKLGICSGELVYPKKLECLLKCKLEERKISGRYSQPNSSDDSDIEDRSTTPPNFSPNNEIPRRLTKKLHKIEDFQPFNVDQSPDIYFMKRPQERKEEGFDIKGEKLNFLEETKE